MRYDTPPRQNESHDANSGAYSHNRSITEDISSGRKNRCPEQSSHLPKSGANPIKSGPTIMRVRHGWQEEGRGIWPVIGEEKCAAI